MRKLTYKIDSSYDGKKLIAYLRGKLKMSSRLTVTLKHTENGILLNGSHARTVDIIYAGDILELNLPEDNSKIEPVPLKLDIAYEDDDILVINKPAYLAVHPTHNHQGDTLANAVASYYEEKNENISFRAIGRLDKCTSGLITIAKNKFAAFALQGKIDKTYFAIAEGDTGEEGIIDSKIYRPFPDKTIRAAGNTGDDALTKFKRISYNNNLSFCEVKIETGRTHQIRVHFSSVGHPLAGDVMYGGHDNLISRTALHCGRLNLIQPVTKKELEFSAPLPNDMESLLTQLTKE